MLTINESRLWDRHIEMARIGATPDGGVTRLALTEEDIRARALLIRWAEDLGFRCEMDAICNLYIRREGDDPDAAPVMSGSHTDTQPRGGRFDGIYGVLAAFEVLEILQENGIRTRRPLEAVVWTHEEGSRFDQGSTGSRVFADPASLPAMLAMTDAEGMSLRDVVTAANAATSSLARRPLGAPVAAFLEVHIEQGPILEEANCTIGVVTGIQGLRNFSVEVIGESAHAGTTPRLRRKDALSDAVGIISALEHLMHDPDDIARFTIGRLMVEPNAPSVVPERVKFTIDFRHPDAAVLRTLGDRIGTTCRDAARNCGVRVTELRTTLPDKFPAVVRDIVTSAAARLGLSHMPIFSGASHDARYLAQRCPAGMIFVPCEKGISHSEAENAKRSDLAAGGNVLLQSVIELAGR